ncbi:AMP-binding protein [Myxococcota bacterium]|nr:AMP-binding protein [Myxococcota bacterium]
MSDKTEIDPAQMPFGADEITALESTIQRAKKSELYRERLSSISISDADCWRKIPLTSRSDLQKAGLSGTRAAPLEKICHYGESSGTTGASNTTWLTADDLTANASRIKARHPEIFSAGRIILNRFPFMAAPAHLIQLVAQLGGGVSIPAGNINWDVPFPRALEMAQTTRAEVLAGLPLEPIVLERMARERGLDPATDFNLEYFFLGGAPLPSVMQRRIERIWKARVVELYGSTETMLLGTSCEQRSLHIETDLAFCEYLQLSGNEIAADWEKSRLVVTTLGIEGSPLVRFDTGDVVQRLPDCPCGDPRPALRVLGRVSDAFEIEGKTHFNSEIIEAAGSAADAIDSSVFFAIALPDRLVVRIEADSESQRQRVRDARDAFQACLPDIPCEIELTEPNAILDIEQIGRSPTVYKPAFVSNWKQDRRRLISVTQGMMEWPAPSAQAIGRMALRATRGALRRRRLKKSV